MANCRICGETVKAAPILCPRCREAMMQKFCDCYCRFPREVEEDELWEICAMCPIVRYC